MKAFLSLIGRDLLLARRHGGALAVTLGFYLMVITMLPLGLGPSQKLLGRIAPGVLWVALLLSSLLSADRMFHDDHEDGSLEVIALGPLPMELVALAKMLAHWLTVGVPLMLITPVLALMLNMNENAFVPLMLTLMAGTPAVSFLAGIGAALTLGLRKGGPLLSLIIMPLYVPTLIFGVMAIDAVITGPGSFSVPFSILCGITLISAVISPLATAAALKLNLQ
ncbi:MAG: heme exporter protein CcmB [Alphaproteobacteria bacterium]